MAGLPALPAKHNDFISYLAKNAQTPMAELLQPYRAYDAKIRELFAQEPDHPVLRDHFVNVVPVFEDHTNDIKIRARNLSAETAGEMESYIMPLKDADRKPNGSPAVVQSLKEFQHNFNVFSELSLADLDWNNVIAAGSSVVTSLLPVPEEYRGSKRALRQYYHEVVAPASDVDLFLYGLTEEEAIEKIKQIEKKIRDAILQETTTIRTKNAITIASQHPIRHVQIVLRLYNSVSEILTGFDVDCSCVAYDGKQVYAAPRALSAYITQINQIDLTRRSPSYENRLSKYSHRGFEVFWSQLDRSRVDPTIFERSFQRTVGLARLLVLEKLPTSDARDNYLEKRRRERGRPMINRYLQHVHRLRGNIKNDHEDEVAEWVTEDEVSDYHTFTVPYGPKFHARKIEKLLYTKDLLLNAEWNKPKDREVDLHRHPAFFGYAEDVINDCCGYCPKPSTPEEEEVAKEEGKTYVSGKISFLKDDPGRQSIGSFNPITDDDWTEMAYVGNTARLCQAIVECDLEHVEDWLSQESANPNQRDYTGRTPLHLAVMCSTPAIVKCLVNRGARLVARLADGRTALHIAAANGNLQMVKILMERSEANEAEEEMKRILKSDARKAAKKQGIAEQEKEPKHPTESNNETNLTDDDTDYSESDEDVHSVTTGSFVRVEKGRKTQPSETPSDDDEDEPDFYDVDVTAWDSKCSPLHLAIINGHVEIVKELCGTFGADILIPVKLVNEWSAKSAILTLVLALRLPWEKAKEMVLTLLNLGASSAQADLDGVTAFHHSVNYGSESMQLLFDNDKAAVRAAIKHLVINTGYWNSCTTSPLTTALENNDTAAALKLLDFGIASEYDFGTWFKAAKNAPQGSHLGNDPDKNLKNFKQNTDQPIIAALEFENPDVVLELLKKGADPNTLAPMGHQVMLEENMRHYKGETVMDVVKRKLKLLRQYSGEQFYAQEPLQLEHDSYYLANIELGTYKHWAASISLEKAKQKFKNDLEEYERQLKQHETRPGLDLKTEVIRSLIKKLEEVEEELLRRNGKTFKQLHPDIWQAEDKDGDSLPKQYHRTAPKPFEIVFNFQRGDLTETMRELYIELFQATWNGDIATIKKLTLAPVGPNQNEPPLQIAVMDSHQATPFSIAIMRGHLDIAKAILEIAKAQFEPDTEVKRERYSIAPRGYGYEDSVHSSEASVEGGDDIRVFREIVDDDFTIENIGEVSLQVKSKVTPLQLLESTYPVPYMLEPGVSLPKPYSSTGHGETMLMSLFAYAILADNLKLLKFLIGLGEEYTRSGDDKTTTSSRIFSFRMDDFYLAILHGRIQHIAEIMNRTGAGIPLEDLLKSKGIQIKENAKYYQGLSVHGRKRTDWATAGRNIVQATKTGSKHSPLLLAAKEGNIECVEWMLSNAPMRHYLAFAAANKGDKRINALGAAGDGFDRAVSTWFGAGSELLLHCAIFAPTGPNTLHLISYLIKAFPSSINKKSIAGYSPLYLAFSLCRPRVAMLLIEAGAHKDITDQDGNSLLHTLLIENQRARHEEDSLRGMIDLLDPESQKKLFTQRNSYTNGAATPLHLWLKNTRAIWGAEDDADKQEAALRMLLSYSKGEELGMVDGAGETPLHTLVTLNKPNLMRILLDRDPMLLYRENATGRTPAEVAYDDYMAPKLQPEKQVMKTWRTSPQSVVNKNPEGFVKCNAKFDEGLPWGVCKEYMERFPGKRKLVSLNEANEVARRLAETQKMNQRHRRMRNSVDMRNEAEEDDNWSDVVSLWYNDAMGSWNEGKYKD